MLPSHAIGISVNIICRKLDMNALSSRKIHFMNALSNLLLGNCEIILSLRVGHAINLKTIATSLCLSVNIGHIFITF